MGAQKQMARVKTIYTLTVLNTGCLTKEAMSLNQHYHCLSIHLTNIFVEMW